MNLPETSLPTSFVSALQSQLGERVRLELADRTVYAYDNSRRESIPGAVCFPRDHDDVVAVTKLCFEHEVPITARGLGSGTTGAAVPIQGGIVLSTERMRTIKRIDTRNRVVVVEPGVTNADLQAALAEQGFFWPPDPTSAAYSTIGGNLACNAAGPHAVKYGTPRENTLGLVAVTGTGEVLRTGVATSKGVVGYDLTRLLVGSEGTLGIVTEATLRILPLASARCFLRASYSNLESATRAVANIMANPETPSALEFMDPVAVSLVRDYAEAGLPVDAQAILLIEIDGNEPGVDAARESVERAAVNDGVVEIKLARTESETRALWACRKALSPALRKMAPEKINEDVVVPVTQLTTLVKGLQTLADRHEIKIVSFGHAGNGNLHVNLLGDPAVEGEMARMQSCLRQVFALVLDLGGTLSGEHGIGLQKKEFVDMELDPVALALMRKIKQQFDPKHLLNPGKLFPG